MASRRGRNRKEFGRIKNYTNLVDIHARVLSLTARIVAPWIGIDR